MCLCAVLLYPYSTNTGKLNCAVLFKFCVDKFIFLNLNSEFRQGVFELRMWPNKTADGSAKTTTPGIISDQIENDLEEGVYNSSNAPAFNLGNDDNKNTPINANTTSTSNNQTNTTLTTNSSSNSLDEFPILDELDRLAKVRIEFKHKTRNDFNLSILLDV